MQQPENTPAALAADGDGSRQDAGTPATGPEEGNWYCDCCGAESDTLYEVDSFLLCEWCRRSRQFREPQPSRGHHDER
jgi:hypothetical protein